MNDFDEMVSNMLTWSDDNIKAEELDCNLTINYPSATDADKNEARQVLRAIYEARNLRKKIAAARDKWDEMQEGERLARIELYKDEAKAAMQAERGTQQPQQEAHPMSEADRKRITGYTNGKNIAELQTKVLEAAAMGRKAEKSPRRLLREAYGTPNYIAIGANYRKLVSERKWLKDWSQAIGYKISR